MTSHYHAVVWIDHHEAKVFHFDRDSADKIVIHADNPSVHLHHKANSIASGHAAEDEHFLEHVAQAIYDAGAILITGPANEKTELIKHLHRHHPKLVEHVAAVETIDHPSDNKLVAHARDYFHADHQMRPRAFQRNAPVDKPS